MIDDDVQDLPLLDERARAAARGLQDHMRGRVDIDASLTSLPTGRRALSASRIGAIAAVAALFVGAFTIANGRLDGQADRREAIHTGELRPLGPRDGKDSIRLPIAVEPNVGLHDGDTVTVSGTGFVPGESVGVVQCANEAGGEVREERAGIDGCYVSGYASLTADANGVVTGTYQVRRILTTPITGTIDCAAEVGRCLIGVGALNDYDRSGGHAIEFATDVAPVALPTATVAPAEGLADGDEVRVLVDGVGPNEIVQLEVCAVEYIVCWQTGAEIVSDRSIGSGPASEDEDGTWHLRGLQADGDGHVDGEVPVWRYLPGPEGGTYVDCAATRCQLRIIAETSPAPVALGFASDGAPPEAPVIALDRVAGLQPGDDLLVHGSGFQPGAVISVSLCVSESSDPAVPDTGCWGLADGIEPGDDGAFGDTYELPATLGLPSETMATCDPAACEDQGGSEVPVRCDGTTQWCAIVVDVHSIVEDGGLLPLRPVFTPARVEIRFG